MECQLGFKLNEKSRTHLKEVLLSVVVLLIVEDIVTGISWLIVWELPRHSFNLNVLLRIAVLILLGVKFLASPSYRWNSATLLADQQSQSSFAWWDNPAADRRAAVNTQRRLMHHLTGCWKSRQTSVGDPISPLDVAKWGGRTWSQDFL